MTSAKNKKDVASVKIESLKTKDGKKLLKALKVQFPSNSVTAIMGPSGSGKSTFLNYVSGNMPSGLSVKGKGKTCEKFLRQFLHAMPSKFSSRTIVEMNGLKVLVPQDDHLHGFYTCQTYLEHYARLSGQESHDSQKKIKNILADLGLTACKDVKVGDVFVKGLSGGQKRRLSVALEALSSPENFFLDEPTSGLDSESAFQVMKYLKSYVQKGKGRRVILTIHQPSSYLWQLIDNVVLLAKGRVIYAGPREHMETFFEIQKYPTPPSFNPADHYVTVANDEFRTEDGVDKLSVHEWAEKFRTYRKDPSFVVNIKDARPEFNGTSRSNSSSKRAGDVRTVVELTRRYALNLWFNPGILFVRVFMYSILSLMLGALFWKLGEKDSFGSIQSRIALLFYVCAFFIFMSVAVLPFTVAEKSIVDKEVRNRYYRPELYQFAQAISSIPGVVILAGLGTGIVIGMTEMNEGGWYFLNLSLALFCAEALAQFVSHLIPHFIIGMALIAGVSLIHVRLLYISAFECSLSFPFFMKFYGMFMLLEGFMLIPSEFPAWLKWAYYVPFHTYSWRTFMYKEFSGDDSVFDSVQFPTGMDVLRAYEIDDVNPSNDMLLLFFYGLLIHFFSFIVLHIKFARFKGQNKVHES